MTGNSSKFFRKNILLTTVSSAALLFGGENAFAAAARTTTAPNVNFVTGVGLDGALAFVPGSTLQFTGAHNVANATFNILAVDMNNKITTAFVDNNISIGSIVDTSVAAGGKIAVSVDARTLTLIGKGTNGTGFATFAAADNIYTALGDITFNGDPIGIIMVQSYNNVATTLSGNIISNKAGSGTLNLNTDTQIDGTIGATNSLLAVRIGTSTATLGGAVIKAQNFNLGNDSSVLTLTGAGANLTGSIVNTAAANNGTVNLNGTINITGNVGTVNALNTINVAGLGAVKINGTVNTTKFVMKGDNTTAAEVTGLLTGDVTFTADSQLTPTGGITGSLTVDNGGKVVGGGNVSNGVTVINGSVAVGDVTGGGVEVEGGAATVGAVTGGIIVSGGTLDFASGGNVVIIGGEVTAGGAIGGKLAVSNGGKFTGAATDVTGTVTVSGDDTEVTIRNTTGDVTVAGGILDLVDAEAGMTITGGKVYPTGTITGNLEVSGGGDLVGAEGVTDVGGTVTLQATTGRVVINDAAGVVTVSGGTLDLRNADKGINFALGAFAGTAVYVAAGGSVNDVKNITGVDGIGILAFVGAGQAGIIGGADPLSAIKIGAGLVRLQSGVVKVNAINLTDDAGKSAIQFADQAVVTGAITNISGADNKGTVTFQASAGNSSIAGGVGLDGAALETLNTKVDAGKVITLGGDVYTQNLVLDDTAGGNAVGTVKIAGDLFATNVNFGADANGGILEFNGAAIVPYLFDGAIAKNANKGTLKVNTTVLVALDASVANLKAINIVDTKTLDLDASAGDITLPAAQTIIFAGVDSKLGFSNVRNRPDAQVIFSGDFVPTNDGEGRIIFSSTDPDDLGDAAPNGLTIISDDPGNPRKIGNAAVGGKKFANLSVFDQVIIDKTIDLSGIAELDVVAGANFVDKGATTAQIATINIGVAYPLLNVAATGPATYTIDANGGDVPILQAGKAINFAHADAVLVLQNSSNANNGTITLNQTLNPAGNNEGVVTLNSVDAKRKLTIAAGVANVSLGGANKLNKIVFTGAGEFDTTVIKTNTTDIELNVSKISLGETTANITFKINTQLTQAGNIGGFVDFNNNNAELTLNNGVNIGGVVKNTGGNSNGTIIAAGASTINGPITNIAMLKVGAVAVAITAGGDNSITEIQGTGTDTLTLPENFKLTGSINATDGQAVKLNFKGGTNSISGIVGTQANPVGGITTAGATTFTSAVNSKGPITTTGNTTFSDSLNNIGDVTTSGTTTYTGAYTNKGTSTFGGTTNFADTFSNTGAVITSGTTIFTGAYTNAGTAKFGGTTSFADTFNNTGAVTLAPASINNFAKNVIATSFVASNATMNFGNSSAFNSDIIGSGTTINLGSEQLAYTGQSSFSGKLTIATSYDQVKNSGGNIVIKSGSKMDLSPLDELDIRFNGAGIQLEEIDENTKFSLITSADGNGLVPLSSVDKIKFFVNSNDNSFIKWSINTSSLTLSAEDIADESLEKEITTGDLQDAPEDVKEAIKDLITAVQGSDGDKAKGQLGFMTPTQKKEAVNHLIQNAVRVGGKTAMANRLVVANNITGNLASLNSRIDRIQAAQAAVAAGDGDEASFGMWGSPFVGDRTQKAQNNISGYKSNSKGATIGFDGLVGDDLLLGVAYTRTDTKVKQKNKNVGDKSKVQSDIYSLYGLYNLPNQNWFFEGIVSYGDSRVKNYSQRSVAVSKNVVVYQTATGKYKSRSYTGQILAGYSYLAPEKINLTPMVGLRYSGIKDVGYVETGTAFQNLIVKGKKYNSIEGLAGVKASKDINTGHMILTPTLYGMLDYNFKGKIPAIDARLQGMTVPFPAHSFKSPKTSFNLGTGVTAKYQMMEYGINYDANIASKYFAQQGSLKVRVNF